MLLFVSRLLSSAFGGRPPSRPKVARRRRLGVENLEERDVPATLVWTAAVSDDWSVAGNWKDRTTSVVSATPPDATTNVEFDFSSPTTCWAKGYLVAGGLKCASLTSLGWVGGELLVDGALAVTGGTFGASIQAKAGRFGSLTVTTGTFNYGNGILGDTFSGGSLAVYVEGGGTMNLERGGMNVKSSIYVGRTGTFASAGTLTVSRSATMTWAPTVRSTGTLRVGDDAIGVPATLTCAEMISTIGGKILIDGGSTIASAVSVSGNGTFLVEGPSTKTNTVAGNVYLSGGSVLRMGSATNTFQNLSIQGELRMTDALLTIDVDGGWSPGHDKVTAYKVSLISGNILNTFTAGAPVAGTTHQVLKAAGETTSALVGTFSYYAWNGTGATWSRTYDPTSLTLGDPLILIIIIEEETPGEG